MPLSPQCSSQMNLQYLPHCQVAYEAYEDGSGEVGPADQGGGLGIAG